MAILAPIDVHISMQGCDIPDETARQVCISTPLNINSRELTIPLQRVHKQPKAYWLDQRYHSAFRTA